MVVTKEAVGVRSEKAYEKYAWIILFALGLFQLSAFGFGYWILGGLGGNLQADSDALKNFTGITWDQLVARIPGIGSYISLLGREVGINDIGYGILVTAVSFAAYRKGERWAWYALWVVPARIIGFMANDLSGGSTFGVSTGLPFIVIALLGLLLLYRKFFPRKV